MRVMVECNDCIGRMYTRDEPDSEKQLQGQVPSKITMRALWKEISTIRIIQFFWSRSLSDLNTDNSRAATMTSTADATTKH
jgi:hypothetical protein